MRKLKKPPTSISFHYFGSTILLFLTIPTKIVTPIRPHHLNLNSTHIPHPKISHKTSLLWLPNPGRYIGKIDSSQHICFQRLLLYPYTNRLCILTIFMVTTFASMPNSTGNFYYQVVRANGLRSRGGNQVHASPNLGRKNYSFSQ